MDLRTNAKHPHQDKNEQNRSILIPSTNFLIIKYFENFDANVNTHKLCQSAENVCAFWL